jgi:transposase
MASCNTAWAPLVNLTVSTVGQWRWLVERTFAWLNQFRRLRVRYERRADIHEAFLSLGCLQICWHHFRSLPG